MIVCTAIIQCLADLLLRNGNIELAKEHLIKSAQVVGSPVLGSFGPKFSLAKELLEHNEKKAVEDYLNLCGVFWQSHRNHLNMWKSDVRKGKIPAKWKWMSRI